MSFLRSLLAWAAVALSVGCALGGVLAQFGRWNPWLDILTHLAPLFALGGAFAIILTMIGSGEGRPTAIALSSLSIVAGLILVAPEFLRPLGPRAPAGRPGQIKVIQFNLWRENIHVREAIDWVQSERPDIVVMEETSSSVRDLMRERGWHVAGFATTTMIFTRSQYLGMYRPPAADNTPLTWVNATYLINGAPMEIIATHVSWPTEKDHAAQNLGLRLVASAFPKDRMILVGDFNSAPWSFDRRREDAALGLIRRDRALMSWPTNTKGSPHALPFPILPIDHVYAGPGWATVSVRRGPSLGSDHYPVVVTLAPAR